MPIPRLQDARWTAVLLLFLSSCGTMENNRGWGQDAVLWPGWSRISSAAINSALDLQTLLPTVGAAVFAIGDLDEEVSEWAARENPIFGSRSTAEDFSDWGVGVLSVEAFVTLVSTLSTDSDTGDWTLPKLKGFLVESSAAGVSWGVMEGLKSAVDRRRPSGEDTDSFPSGHTSGAFTAVTLANRNLNSIRLPGEARLSLQITNLAAATAVGWARVEGNKHFPSDVLAGAALGHFLTSFIHDAFLGLPEDKRFGFVLFSPGGRQAMIGFSVTF